MKIFKKSEKKYFRNFIEVGINKERSSTGRVNFLDKFNVIFWLCDIAAVDHQNDGSGGWLDSLKIKSD